MSHQVLSAGILCPLNTNTFSPHLSLSQNKSSRLDFKMRFPCIFIGALLSLTGTVLTQHDDGPPRHPTCPATQDTREFTNDGYEQTAVPVSEVRKDDSGQRDRPSQALIEPSVTTVKSGDSTCAQQPHQQAARRPRKVTNAVRASAHQPRAESKRVVVRHPLPAESILYYRRRRYDQVLLEIRARVDRQVFLAVSDYSRRIDGYKLKAGNYMVEL